jgi:hypothetical protein
LPDAFQPCPRSVFAAFQSFVLSPCPAHQMAVDALADRDDRAWVERGEVIQPAPQGRFTSSARSSRLQVVRRCSLPRSEMRRCRCRDSGGAPGLGRIGQGFSYLDIVVHPGRAGSCKGVAMGAPLRGFVGWGRYRWIRPQIAPEDAFVPSVFAARAAQARSAEPVTGHALGPSIQRRRPRHWPIDRRYDTNAVTSASGPPGGFGWARA